MLPSLDLGKLRVLEFYEVDEERFPLIKLARKALREGESLPVALNASNEMAVKAFLDERIKFSDISGVVKKVVLGHKKKRVQSLDDIFEVDRQTREKTSNLLKQRY